MKLNNMTPTEFLAGLGVDACDEGRKFAHRYPTMADVWDHCQRVDWLFWIIARIGMKQNKRKARKFMTWCARHTPISVNKTVWDLLTHSDSRKAVLVANAVANGRAAESELSAARSAAESAARSAAESAAWSAAEMAAWSAARLAAESAARSAARSAAWSAARSAAWSAARSAAESAARSAARSAAESAAWSAARSAAESAQADALRKFIGKNPFRN